MFDARQFLVENFRDIHGVAGLLRAYKLPTPPTDTIRKWFDRGAIPSDWLPVLVCCLTFENGDPPRLTKYLHIGGDA